MIRSVYIYLLTFCSITLGAQPYGTKTTTGSPIELIPELTIDGRFYPEFLLGEKFYNSQIEYRISDKILVEIQLFYSRYGIKERIRMPMLLKARISNNLYLVAGPEMEYDMGKEVDSSKPRLSLNSGVEYRRDDGFYINALFNYQLNNSNIGPQGNIGKSNMISVGSGIKF